MTAERLSALFQWLVSFVEKLIAKIKELFGIITPDEDSTAA